jgi:hypothetical protein
MELSNYIVLEGRAEGADEEGKEEERTNYLSSRQMAQQTTKRNSDRGKTIERKKIRSADRITAAAR